MKNDELLNSRFEICRIVSSSARETWVYVSVIGLAIRKSFSSNVSSRLWSIADWVIVLYSELVVPVPSSLRAEKSLTACRNLRIVSISRKTLTQVAALLHPGAALKVGFIA
jgi:hypothetical protein